MGGGCFSGAGKPFPYVEPAYKFFGVPIVDYSSCLAFKITSKNELIILTRGINDGWDDDKWKPVGKALLKETLASSGIYRNTVSVWLTPEQKVFGTSELDNFNLGYLNLYQKQEATLFVGEYKNLEGTLTRQVNITATPEGTIRFSGLLDGVLFPDLMLDHRL